MPNTRRRRCRARRDLGSTPGGVSCLCRNWSSTVLIKTLKYQCYYDCQVSCSRVRLTLPQSETCHLAQWPRLQLRTRGTDGAGLRHAASFTRIVSVAEISCLHVNSRVCTPSPHVALHDVHSPSTHLKNENVPSVSQAPIKATRDTIIACQYALRRGATVTSAHREFSCSHDVVCHRGMHLLCRARLSAAAHRFR